MSVRLAGTPESALATGLPPVLRTYRPKVVRVTMTDITIGEAQGQEHDDRDARHDRPVPRLAMVGSKISVSLPLAMTSAMPRPATSMPRVATMGWMPTTRRGCR